MGLFSLDETIAVSSVVYNMAGDELDRPNYLQSLVVRNVLSGTKESIGSSLNQGYLYGPGIKLRQFFRWTKREGKYDQVGIPTGNLDSSTELDPADLAPLIPTPPGQIAWVETAVFGSPDATYWAEQWIFDNRPADIDTAWKYDYFVDTNTITIHFVDTSTVTIPATGFDVEEQYLYAYVTFIDPGSIGPIVPGSLVHIGAAAFPTTTGWTLDSSSLVNHPVTLVTNVTVTVVTDVTYSDARPPDHSSSTTGPTTSSNPTSYDTGEWIYSRHTYNGGDAVLTSTNEFRHDFQSASVSLANSSSHTDTVVTTDTIAGGVTRTTTVATTTTTVVDRIDYDRSYRIDTQAVVVEGYSNMSLYIYQIGSGIPAIDALVSSAEIEGEFFAPIPIRTKNEFWSETNKPEAYAQTQKAYKKATGSKLIDLVDKIKNNDSLDDIDNAYVVFGVSLNVLEEACKRYIYAFFKKASVGQTGSYAHYADWQATMTAYIHDMNVWIAWKEDQIGMTPSPGLPPPSPPKPSYPSLPRNQVRVTTKGGVPTRFDMRINFLFVDEQQADGLGRPGAKMNDCWIQYMGETTYEVPVWSQASGANINFLKHSKFRIYWQKAGYHTWLDVIGASHSNYVYEGKFVETSAKDALEDPDESGFIIPIHYDTWKEISLVNSTQMATACMFIVFNCYEVHKQRWYETFIFRIVLVIVLAIVTAVIFPGGVGLLGAHMAIGTMMGFSGIGAAIVGSIVNSMAALILTTLVEKFVIQFGPLGQMIGAIFMIFVGSFAASFQSGGTMALDWGTFMKPDSLIRLTEAAGKTITGFINQDTQGVIAEGAETEKKARRKKREIEEAYIQEFGYGGAALDPSMFTDTSSGTTAESSATFLTRTLMSGGDIANLAQDMIENFTSYVNVLPDPVR